MTEISGTEDVISPQIPSYSFGLIGSKGDYFATGNAVLLDKARGIFLTVAHAFTRGCDKWRIWFPTLDRNALAETNPKWIDWDADLAFVKLPERLFEKLAPFDNASFYAPEEHKAKSLETIPPIFFTGLYRITNQIDPLFSPFRNKGHIVEFRSHFGVTYPMMQERWRAEEKWLPLAKKDRAVLFDRYIWAHCEKEIIPSMSGSILLDPKDRPLGIISRGLNYALAIPSSRINETFRRMFPG